MRIKKYILISGIIMLITGILYDSFFVGLPYQDPDTAMTAVYNRNNMIAETMMLIGVVVLALWVLLRIINLRIKILN